MENQQKQKSKQKLLHTQFQKVVGESAQKIDSLLDEVNDNNIDLKNDVDKIEEQMEQLELEKKMIAP